MEIKPFQLKAGDKFIISKDLGKTIYTVLKDKTSAICGNLHCFAFDEKFNLICVDGTANVEII